MSVIIHVKHIFQMGTIKFTEITVLFCSFLLGRTLIILQRSVSYYGRPLFWKACNFQEIFLHSKNWWKKIISGEPWGKSSKCFIQATSCVWLKKIYCPKITWPRKQPNPTPQPLKKTLMVPSLKIISARATQMKMREPQIENVNQSRRSIQCIRAERRQEIINCINLRHRLPFPSQ